MSVDKRWRINTGLSDEEWIAEVEKILDPKEMLECLLDYEHMFGDGYFRKLTTAMWKQAQKLVNT